MLTRKTFMKALGIAALLFASRIEAAPLVTRDEAFLAKLNSQPAQMRNQAYLNESLQHAALRQWTKSIGALLAWGANPDAQTDIGNTALMILVRGTKSPEQERENAEFLRDAPPGTKIVNWAFEEEREDNEASSLAQLLAKTKNIDARDISGHTALMIAGSKERFDLVIALAKAGADINAAAADRSEAIVYAPPEWIEPLARAGAQLGPTNRSGNTLLHYLMRFKSGPKFLAYIEAALRAGAKDKKNAYGVWASDEVTEFAVLFGTDDGQLPRRLEDIAKARALIRASR
ncbi:MAG: ankyrin repeat domain-containing protein [Pseudomonadota bacterium]